MDYVVHTCKQCKCAFIAEDFTKVRDIPPRWRLYPECAEEQGIKYEKQRPWNCRSEKQQEFYKRFAEIGKQNLQKAKASKVPQ